MNPLATIQAEARAAFREDTRGRFFNERQIDIAMGCEGGLGEWLDTQLSLAHTRNPDEKQYVFLSDAINLIRGGGNSHVCARGGIERKGPVVACDFCSQDDY